MIVELYDGHRTIAQEVITTFKDNRGTPLVKINPDANMEEIEFKEPSDIAIFSSAVSDSTVEPGISYIVYPEYIFSLGKESYFLWIAEDDGYIMNTKDTYTLYSLSNYSFEKVKGVIDYID